MDAAIYFPLFLVLVTADLKKYAIHYLAADLQSPELFKSRTLLSKTARRAGWQAFTYESGAIKERFVRLI